MTQNSEMQPDFTMVKVNKPQDEVKSTAVDNLHHVSIQENEAHQTASPIQLREDNQAVLTLVKDTHVHEWSKHIDIAYHNICDLHKQNQIQVEFVPSQEMMTDELAKPLPRRIFDQFVELLGLTVVGLWMSVGGLLNLRTCC